MSAPRVTIITPCFNGEAYLNRYFRSILDQTYSNIELIFVDDGSTDNTFAIAESWRMRLEGRGIDYKLLTHENSGQASAINLALPDVDGEYVTWPDSDDLMDPCCIERKVTYLEEHPKAGFVICAIRVVDESDLQKVTSVQRFDRFLGPHIFEALLTEQKSSFCSNIAYMARKQCLFDAIGGNHIYESRAGQNWQLLLPLTYHYDCGYIDDVLATYVVRSKSHSHSFESLEEQLERTFELQDLLAHVLPNIGMTDEDFKKYLRYVSVKYLDKRFKIYVGLGNVVMACGISEQMDREFGSSQIRNLLLWITKVGLGPTAYTIGRFVKAALRMLKSIIGGN